MSPTAPPIAVTGATGQLGGRVARRLAAAGVPQRLLVRDPERAPQLPGADVVRAPHALAARTLLNHDGRRFFVRVARALLSLGGTSLRDGHGTVLGGALRCLRECYFDDSFIFRRESHRGSASC